MIAQLTCCIAVLSVGLSQVNGLISIPNIYHKHSVSDPRVEALNHRIATLHRTLSDLQRQRFHSHPRPVAPQPAPIIRRVHSHVPIRSQPLNYHIVRSPFTSDLLDHMGSKYFEPEAPYEFYTTYVPDQPFFE